MPLFEKVAHCMEIVGYTLMLKVLLWVDLYMTRKDQVFVIDVVVINPTRETMISSVIN